MFWGCITYDGIGVLVPVDGNLNSVKYIELLDNHLWPVVTKVFGNRQFIFQDDNAPSPPPLDRPILGNKKTAFKNSTGLHNPQTLMLLKMSGVVSKSNCPVRLMTLNAGMT